MPARNSMGKTIGSFIFFFVIFFNATSAQESQRKIAGKVKNEEGSVL
jgi:hypothetical protein